MASWVSVLASTEKKIGIKKKNLYRAMKDKIGISPRRAQDICNGHISSPDLDAVIVQDIVLWAAEIQAREIKNNPTPKRSLNTDNAYKKYREGQAQKAAQILTRAHKMFAPVEEHLKQLKLAKLPPFPIIKAPFLLAEERFLLEGEKAFFGLTPQCAYTLSRNFEAFAVLSSPTIAEFHRHISLLDSAEKVHIKKLLFEVSCNLTVEEIINLLNNPVIQQWRRILSPEYAKSFSVRYAHARKERSSMRKPANTIIMREAWSKLFEKIFGLNLDVEAFPENIIQNTDILNNRQDMKLIYAFLCCASEQNQHKVLDMLKQMTGQE